MNSLYTISSVGGFLILLGILIALFCMGKRPGRVLLIIGFALQAFSSLYFALSGILFRYAFEQGWDSNELFQAIQYINAVVSILNLVGMLLVLLGFIWMAIESKKQIRTVQYANPAAAPPTAAPPTAAPPAGPVIIPHRSGLLLGLGIVGLFCWPVAPVIRYFSAKDLASMRKSELDNTGYEAARIAYVLGTIGTLLMIGVTFSAFFLWAALTFGPR